MGIATFLGSSPHAGQSLEYYDGCFRVGAGGPCVAPAEVQQADTAGVLAWSGDSSRDWFYGNLNGFESSPASTSPPAVAGKRRWVMAGVLGSVAWIVLVAVPVFILPGATIIGRAATYVAVWVSAPGLLIVWIVAAVWGYSARRVG